MSDNAGKKLNHFAEDVRRGLSAAPKFLSSKYFYDDAGSEIFRQIMNLPDYYLTRAEAEIFSGQKREIIESFTAQNKSFDLVELGAGDGAKTTILIDCLLKQNVDFSYAPIDISAQALEVLTEKFKIEFPALSIKPFCGDYFQILDALKFDSARAKIIFFLGSNIGNFSITEAISFLKKMRSAMGENHLLLIGFDLQKDPRIILKAYDDEQGVTADFNLNLLTRINRELGANFNRERFSHYADYCPATGAARSFLVSREKQIVFIECLGEEFLFAAHETIFMEISQKYHLPVIEQIALASGFEIVRNFFDESCYFADSLWKAG